MCPAGYYESKCLEGAVNIKIRHDAGWYRVFYIGGTTSMAERQKSISTRETSDEKVLDPAAVSAFDFLTNKRDFTGMTYDEIMAADGEVDDLQVVDHRRGRNKSENTLYLSELLVGSQYSDNEFFNQIVDTVGSLPPEQKPDQVIMSGLYMGDFGGRNKNSRWTLQPGLRTLNEQFLHGKAKLDQLRELGIPVIYSMSDNDTAIVEEMTFEAFQQMHALAKKHARENADSDDVKRQLSSLERAKANPNWPEYYRFTQAVAFPYCVRSGRALRTAAGVSELTDGLFDEPEREILYDAYKRASKGGRLTAKHRAVLDLGALKDAPDLVVVEDFEHHVTTRGAEYTDLVRHRFNTTRQPIANYFAGPKKIRGILAADGKDPHDNYIVTGQREAAGVFGPDNAAIHSIGGLQDPHKALRSKGHILTSNQNVVGREILGRRRFHPASATSIERFDDGTHFITLYNKHLMEVSESIPERTTIMLQCDWQAGNLASRPDYQLKQLDMVNRRLGRGIVYLALGGDIVEGRNYSDFPRENGRTGLMGMDQQFEFVRMMLESSLDQLSAAQMRNLFVRATIGNHEYNSGTIKWNGYSFVEPTVDPYRMAFAGRGFKPEEIRDRVQFQDTLVSDRGEPFKTYETVFHIGEMGVALSHFFGAGKGTGGMPPAFTGMNQTTGLGALREDIDVGIFGHYHHASYLQGGDKLYIGAGSLNGITGFEYDRGLRAANSIVALHIGGGLPPQIEVIGEKALNNYKIPDGPFSDKVLRDDYGLRTDTEFDPSRHSPYLGTASPKSALQKRVVELTTAASHSEGRTGHLANPNR